MTNQKTTAKTRALRGNERIQQLMEEFPEIPRTLVVKTDLIREGTKPSAASRQLGRWALPDAHWYFEYDKEDTHSSEETTEGYTLNPVCPYLPNGICLQPMFDSRSPYEIRYEERGRYRLYRDGEAVEELFFTPRPQWYDRKTSSGKPMASVIQQRTEDRLMVVPMTYCGYAKEDLLCKYCNINASESTRKGLGMERITAKQEQDIYETFVAAAPESHLSTYITMSGGVILGSHKEAEAYLRLIQTLRRAMKDVGIEFPITVLCQALEEKDQLMLKEAGASRLSHNLEVWDARLFEIICPGKAKYVGRQKWMDAILRAKEIYGTTLCAFVCGVEMASPYGFKAEDEAVESVLAGFEWMAIHGVPPGGTFWRPAPGTEFAGMAPPRTEYFLRIALAGYKMALQHDLAPKPSRPPAAGTSIYSDLAYLGLRDATIVSPSRSAGSSQAVC